MSFINYIVILILTEKNIIKYILYRYAYLITMQMQSKFEHKVYDIFRFLLNTMMGWQNLKPGYNFEKNLIYTYKDDTIASKRSFTT